nr:hypothetical protein CFP56_12388 [Quercus suber]
MTISASEVKDTCISSGVAVGIATPRKQDVLGRFIVFKRFSRDTLGSLPRMLNSAGVQQPSGMLLDEIRTFRSYEATTVVLWRERFALVSALAKLWHHSKTVSAIMRIFCTLR